MGDKLLVRVKVSHRETFTGYYALQRFFPDGQTDVEVTPAQLAELKADNGPLMVLELPPGTPPLPRTAEDKEPSKEEVIAASKELARRAEDLEAVARSIKDAQDKLAADQAAFAAEKEKGPTGAAALSAAVAAAGADLDPVPPAPSSTVTSIGKNPKK